ncbi:hypothetical protein [Limobrevibacterium gyesilva]|uniref:Uncharacterized protein n=1 Tax=Limobrevibacterium gyesilva TaxID=2991712 RepID=A0AA41YIK4_9PROT|nr:hypothetical protein [Limobrevibacterium gyesilva]MCW3474231.1 hypothetical protein [Limobrevibacterium gyesilva]
MAFKVNYNQQRAERNRAKQAKKEAKLREREEEAARRKAEREQVHGASPDAPVAETPDPETPAGGTDGTP